MSHTILRSKSLGFGVGQAPNRVEFVVAVYWDNATHPNFARTLMDSSIMEAIDRFKATQQLAGGHWNLELMANALLADEKLGICRVIVQDSFGHTAEGFHETRWPLRHAQS